MQAVRRAKKKVKHGNFYRRRYWTLRQYLLCHTLVWHLAPVHLSTPAGYAREVYYEDTFAYWM